jgi:biopolymer transport protein ExbD
VTLALPAKTRRRRPSLTPMIDVVFLLLVFFMLAARFGTTDATPVGLTGTGTYDGPPRLITLTATEIRLNGLPVAQDSLAANLSSLMQGPGDMILIRPTGTATVQTLLDLMARLREAGLTNLSVLE